MPQDNLPLAVQGKKKNLELRTLPKTFINASARIKRFTHCFDDDGVCISWNHDDAKDPHVC
jgi:hypothetical protein